MRIWYLFILGFVCLQLSAQTAIRHQSSSLTRVKDLWSVTISNQNQEGYEVYLKGIIKEQKSGEVFSGRTANFSIESGDWPIDMNVLYPIQEQLNRRPLSGSNQELPNGRYWFETQLIEARTNRVIGQVSTKSDIKNSTESDDFIAEKDQHFQTNGQAKITYLGQSPVLPNTTYPSNLFRGDFRLDAEAFNVPITVNGLYWSQSAQTGSSANQLQFSYDKWALRQQLIKWLVSQSDPAQAFDSLDIARAKSYQNLLKAQKYPNLDHWKGQLDSFQKDDALAQARQLPNIQAALKNGSLNKQLSELDSLKSVYNIGVYSDTEALSDTLSIAAKNRLKYLFNLEKSVKELKEKEKRLTKEKEKVRKYDKIYKKIKKAENENVGSLLKDDQDIAQGLNIYGYKNKLTRTLLNIDELNVGSIYPYFGQLSLNGVKMNGGNIGYTATKNWHIGAVAGRAAKVHAKDTTQFYASFESPFRQTFLGGQIGYGKVEMSHFYVSYLQCKEMGNDILSNNSTEIHPAENFIAAANFLLKDKNDRVSFSGEYSTSLFNPNRAALSSSLQSTSEVGKIFKSKAKNGSASDDAFQFNLRAELFSKNTDLNVSVLKIGAGYKSLGASFLLDDIFRYEGRITHRMVKNKVNVAAFLKRDFDQLSPLARPYRTFTNSMGLQGNFKLTKSLSANLLFSPISQSNNSVDTATMFHRKGQFWQSSLQYRKQKKITFLSIINWSYRAQKMQDSVLLFNNNTVSFSQQISNKKWSVRASNQISMGKQRDNKSSFSDFFDISASGRNVIKNKGSMTLGVQYFNQFQLAQRQSFYLISNIYINRYFELYLEYRRNYISKSPIIQMDLWQHVGSVGVNLRW
jgi:hypothetical protein